MRLAEMGEADENALVENALDYLNVDRDVHTAETRTPEEIAAQIKNKPKPQMQPEPENDMEIEHDPEPENNMDWLEMEI